MFYATVCIKLWGPICVFLLKPPFDLVFTGSKMFRLTENTIFCICRYCQYKHSTKKGLLFICNIIDKLLLFYSAFLHFMITALMYNIA